MVNDTVVQSGGLLYGWENGGYTGSTTILSGGHVVAGEVRGTLVVSSGADGSTLWVMSDGTVQVRAGSVLSGSTTVSSGGVVSMVSGAALSGNIWIRDGGSACLWADAGGYVNLNGNTNGGLIISGLVTGGDTKLTTIISGFDGTRSGLSDAVQIAGLKAADITNVTYPDADHIVLQMAQGSITLPITGVQSAGYTLAATKNGDLLLEVCFLAGALIRTADGDVAVENLRVGDSVMTWDWKAQAAVERPVVWTGGKHVTVREGLVDDEAGYPVRILKNAIAHNVPSKDLLVTPEHSLFFENRFVPVRMLVNGASIFYDRSITSYDYFHIETEEHAVIWANDTLTESYLNTGNHTIFSQTGQNVRFAVPSARTWQANGAAPLTVERGSVEPLFNALVAHSKVIGCSVKAVRPQLTQYSDIRLLTPMEQVIRPVRYVGDKAVFMLPANIDTVQIASLTSRPSETIGPFVDDRRHLGVLVGQITLFDGQKVKEVTTHLTQPDLPGWDVQETAPRRWTNGAAMLRLPSSSNQDTRQLSLQIISAGPYVEPAMRSPNHLLEDAG